MQIVPHAAEKLQNYYRYLYTKYSGSDYAYHTPFSLIIESSSLCNARCRFCTAHNELDPATNPIAWRRNKLMAEPLLRACLPLAPRACSVYLHGGGEPLLNPHLCSVAADYAGSGAVTGFYTNGALFDRAKIEQLIAAGVRRITVSASAFDAELHARYYCGVDYRRLVENLALLRDLKRARNARFPEISLNVIALKDTMAHLPKLVATAARLGVTAVVLYPLIMKPGIEHMADQQVSYLAERDEPLLAVARAIAAQAGIHLALDSYCRTQAARPAPGPDDLCEFAFSTLYLYPGGDVNPCCMGLFPQTMGNLDRESLEAVWNGPEFRALRRRHLDGKPCQVCATCLASAHAKSYDVRYYLLQAGIEVPEVEGVLRALRAARRSFAAWPHSGGDLVAAGKQALEKLVAYIEVYAGLYDHAAGLPELPAGLAALADQTAELLLGAEVDASPDVLLSASLAGVAAEWRALLLAHDAAMVDWLKRQGGLA